MTKENETRMNGNRHVFLSSVGIQQLGWLDGTLNF